MMGMVANTKNAPDPRKLIKAHDRMRDMYEMTIISNCPNCGAPISNNNRCEYCGTRLYSRYKQVINDITAENKSLPKVK